jgi:hypothetical protein
MKVIKVFQQVTSIDLSGLEKLKKYFGLIGDEKMNNGKYEEVQEYNKESTIEELKSTEANGIVNALLGLTFHEGNWKWVQDICIQYSSHSEYKVRGIAILCFGHLARIHGELDTERVLPIVKKALRDSNEFVVGHANSALDDIQFFVK